MSVNSEGDNRSQVGWLTLSEIFTIAYESSQHLEYCYYSARPMGIASCSPFPRSTVCRVLFTGKYKATRLRGAQPPVYCEYGFCHFSDTMEKKRKT